MLPDLAEHLFECSSVHVQVYGVEFFRQFSPMRALTSVEHANATH